MLTVPAGVTMSIFQGIPHNPLPLLMHVHAAAGRKQPTLMALSTAGLPSHTTFLQLLHHIHLEYASAAQVVVWHYLACC